VTNPTRRRVVGCTVELRFFRAAELASIAPASAVGWFHAGHESDLRSWHDSRRPGRDPARPTQAEPFQHAIATDVDVPPDRGETNGAAIEAVSRWKIVELPHPVTLSVARAPLSMAFTIW